MVLSKEIKLVAAGQNLDAISGETILGSYAQGQEVCNTSDCWICSLELFQVRSEKRLN